MLESNLEELERLGRIAQNILFLAQADHERQHIERTRARTFAKQLETMATYFEGIADERNITFEVHAEGEMSHNAIMSPAGDQQRRRQRGALCESRHHDRLIGSEDAQGASIVIGNQGEPVAPEELARLFDRFYRGDAARSEFTESSGLGLVDRAGDHAAARRVGVGELFARRMDRIHLRFAAEPPHAQS